MVYKASDTLIVISYPENSWHETRETNIVFGKSIYIISKTSYKEGFGERYEETIIEEIEKGKNINPSIICEDIYLELRKVKESISDKLIKKVVKKITNS